MLSFSIGWAPPSWVLACALRALNARSSSVVKLTVVELVRPRHVHPLLLTLLSLSMTFLELLV